MYRIKQLQIENFRGFHRESVDIPDVDIIILAGSNGFGKTSFFDAVEWGFTGSLKRYDNASHERNAESFLKNAYSSRPGHIEIRLSDGKDEFGFTRTTKYERNNDFNEGVLNVAQNDLEQKLIKSVYNNKFSLKDVFNFSHLLSQELINQFVRGFKANERYNVLSSLIGLNEYYNYQDYLKTVEKTITKEYEKVDKNLITLRNEKEKLNAILDKEFSVSTNVEEEYQASIAKYNQILAKDYTPSSRDEFLQELITNIQKLKGDLQTLVEQKTRLTEKIANFHKYLENQNKVSFLKTQIAEFKILQSNLKQLEKLTYVKENWTIFCDYRDKHGQIEELITQIEQDEQVLKIAQDQQISLIEKISTVKRLPSAALLINRGNFADKWNHLFLQIKHNTQRVTTLDEVISQIESLETELIKNALNLLTTDDQTDICPVCLTPIKSAKLIEQLKNRLKSSGNPMLSKSLLERQQLSEELKDLKSQQSELENQANKELIESVAQIKERLFELRSKKTELEEKTRIADRVLLILQGFGLTVIDNLAEWQKLEVKIRTQLGTTQFTSELVADKIKILENELSQSTEDSLAYVSGIQSFNIVELTEGSLLEHLSHLTQHIETRESTLNLLNQIKQTIKKTIKFYNESTNFKRLQEVKRQVHALKKHKEYIHDLRQAAKRMEDKVPEVINEMTKEVLDKYKVTVNEFYRLLNPQPLFTQLDWEISKSYKSGTLILKSISTNQQHSINPSFTYSSAQVNIVALSFFLSFALQQQWSNLNCIFMDDPIQNMDDINIFSFVDVIRSLCFNPELRKQIFISTHDQRFLKFMLKKFRMLKVLVLDYQGYSENGPRIEKREYF